MTSARELIDTLRRHVAFETTDVATQRLYERYLKRTDWHPSNEALPLLVGVDPEHWQRYLSEHDLSSTADRFSHHLSQLTAGRPPGSNNGAAELVAFASANDIDVPPAFKRLFDFIQQTTVQSSTPDLESTQAGERERVLGAALSIVARMPERCRDERGFIDGARVIEIMMQGAARWFPHERPAMGEAEMARLIDEWLQ